MVQEFWDFGLLDLRIQKKIVSQNKERKDQKRDFNSHIVFFFLNVFFNGNAGCLQLHNVVD